MASSIQTLNEAVEALYDLSVGVIGQGSDRHERPHKPALLLAIMDLIAEGSATPEKIPWSPKLRERFAAYFEIVRSHNDQCTPENPFFYLRQDGFWEPLRLENGKRRPLESTPTVGDAAGGKVIARFTNRLDRFVLLPTNRVSLRLAIVSRYFPKVRVELLRLFADGGSPAMERTQVEETVEELHGRNSAFRRKILEIYDCQCAACGLRIKLPEINDLTFVDAAHLIPFDVEFNDNPTNGIALCKNHHWAMDRRLIAPCPDGVWHVSPILKGRRSRGEEELLSLQNEPVLPPAEEAFKPDPRSLQWRCERLVA